jgi:hypothetical protein
MTIVNEGLINGKFAVKSIAEAGFIEIWALEAGSAVYPLQTREFRLRRPLSLCAADCKMVRCLQNFFMS